MTLDFGRLVDLEPTESVQHARDLVNKQGFALVDNFLPQHSVTPMVDAIAELIREDLTSWSRNPHYRDSWMVMNLMFRHRLFVEFLNDTRLREFAEPIIGTNAILYSFTSSSMPPSESNFSRRIHVDSPRFIPEYPTNLGFVIPLTDFTSMNGGTEVLPFSHLREEMPSPAEFSSNLISIEARAGQALLFNARLWHSGGLNQTNSPRHALTVNMCRSFMRQHFDFCRMVNEVFEEFASPEAYSLIGWDVRMPTSLDEYYVEESARLYKSNQG